MASRRLGGKGQRRTPRSLGLAVAPNPGMGETVYMASRFISVDELTAEERVELIGRLWDSLDPATAAPMTDALAAELDRREAEADGDPAAGQPWPQIKTELLDKLR